MNRNVPYYRPPAYYVEAVDKWSSPKWHIRVIEGDNPQLSFDGSGLSSYYGDKTLCGVKVRPQGEVSTERPMIQSELCHKCFGQFDNNSKG